jgi:class 3 adenylate cyclase
MQRCLAGYNQGLTAEEQVLLCVGLGYGDMLRIGDADVFGAEVNAASKLGEDTAQPWEILITGAVHEFALEVDGVSGSQSIAEVPPGADSAYRLEYL